MPPQGVVLVLVVPGRPNRLWIVRVWKNKLELQYVLGYSTGHTGKGQYNTHNKQWYT